MPQPQRLISQPYIKIGGTDISEELSDDLNSIDVEDSLLLPGMFAIRIRDSRFRWTDSNDFAPGTAAEISIGVRDNKTKLITGEITSIEPEFLQGVGETLVIRGYDKSHRLHRIKKTKTYTQVSDSDLARQIASECRLAVGTIDSTGEVHQYVCQDNQTDMEFLRDRAQRVGYYLYVKDGKLNFCKAPSSSNTPVLDYGDNLLQFEARMTTAKQVTKAIVRGWDPKQKKEIIAGKTTPQDTPSVGETRAGGVVADSAFSTGSKEIVVDRPVATVKEAEALAQSFCDELGNAFIQAEGMCEGNADVQAGVIVEIKGVGQRFSGRYRITHSMHHYEESGYTTRFTISGHRMNTIGDILTPRQTGKLGVVVGIVTNNKDPDDMGRVKVKFPTLSSSGESDGDTESDWARLVTLMAGGSRGIEFIPEINDEVLVAFENDDIHRPFVLGSLWNGKEKPPVPAGQAIDGTGKVNKRVIHSRSGHVITLDDTSGSEKISIKDKTGNNLIEIDSSNNSVTIKAQGDMQLEATGKVMIKGSEINVESSGKATVKGSGGVNVESSAQTVVKGSAGVNVEASGNVVVKGAMINLN